MEGVEDDVEDDYAARNRRRTTLPGVPTATQSPGLQHVQRSSTMSDTASMTPPSHSYVPASNAPSIFTGSGYTNEGQIGGEDLKNQEVTNETAAELFRTPIHNPGDALHLLFEAAGRSGDLAPQVTSTNNQHLSPQAVRSTTELGGYDAARPGLQRLHSQHRPPSPIDPAVTGGGVQDMKHDLKALRHAIKAWSRLRFVRAGWFTAREGISYIDYYYKHLAPMTPITPPDFSNPASHPRLLLEEPMLTVALLTITSRYMQLSGPGDISRSFLVHERLWNYLQSMIGRMFWGQEQFGFGFYGAGEVSKKSNPGPAIKDSLKTTSLGSLGTLERCVCRR